MLHLSDRGEAALIFVILIVITLGAIALLLRIPRVTSKKHAEFLKQALAHPETLERAWYVETGYAVILYGRTVSGSVSQIARPSNIGHVWSKLQQAGILVHAKP